MTRIIIACCVLHNICINNGNDGDDFYIEKDMNELNCNEQRDGNVDARNLDRQNIMFREMYPCN